MVDAEDGTTAAVTNEGKVTIPDEFRNALDVDARGRVRFFENEDGEVVIQSVKRPAEIRGALASEGDEDGPSPTELLRKERDGEKGEGTFDQS